MYDELQALRFVLESTSANARGVNLKAWIETQVFNDERGYSELEQPDYVSLD